MDPKNTVEPAPPIDPVTEQVILGKRGVPVYKFSKTGKNLGPLHENEERDHTIYDYSDEM